MSRTTEYFKRTPEFRLDAARGVYPKIIPILQVGTNPDIGTGTIPEDIWGNGGLFVSPTVARIHNIVSTDVNDTLAGTGARKIFISGLNGDYDITTETVTLNGTSNVPTVNSYIIIHEMRITECGSVQRNVGVITATAQTDATISMKILAGNGTALNAIFQVPRNYKFYIDIWDATMFQSTATSFATIHLLYKKFGEGWNIGAIHQLNNNGNNHESDEFITPLEYDEKTIIKATVTFVSNNSTFVQSTFQGVLYKQ